MSIKKITIITPCLNAAPYIEETIKSVLSNTAITSGRASLEYIICDGGSKDGTLDRIDSMLKTADINVNVKVFSEPDNGIYDALSKGLAAGTGDLYAYINAGDFYSPHAFDIALTLFEKERVNWLTGMNVKYNENSHLVHVLVPFRYRKRLIQAGFYGTLFPCIQQESTFWKAELNSLINYEKLSKYRFAGDYFIWKTFSKKAELNIVEAWLGGFRHHKGQLSQDKESYRRELKLIAERPIIEDFMVASLDLFCWHFLPPKLKKKLNPKTFYVFDHFNQTYI